MSTTAPLYLRDLVEREPRALRSSLQVEPPAPAPTRKRSAPTKSTRAAYYREHCAWRAARRRCSNEADPSWRYYGGRGITFYAPWAEPKTGFRSFLEHVGPSPTPRYALCRLDRRGNYEPGNVEWRLKSDVRLGVRDDPKRYDDPPPIRRVVVSATHAKATQNVEIFERDGALIQLGGLKLSANQADDVALALIRMAAEIRRRRLP